jgi:thioredoxin-like negative regulator of GroEL
MSAHTYSTVDAQRLQLNRSALLHKYRSKHTPLGTDSPVVLLAKRKEVQANVAAMYQLDAHLKQDELHKAANALTRQNKMQEARPLLVEAKKLRKQTTTAECAYQLAATAHLVATKQLLHAAQIHAQLSDTHEQPSMTSAEHLLNLQDRARLLTRKTKTYEPLAHSAVLSTEAAANAPSLSTTENNSANFFYPSLMTQKGACT